MTRKKIHTLLKGIKRSPKMPAAIAVFVAFGIAGFLALHYSKAAVFSAAQEAESGAKTGNYADKTDPGASGGKGVVFGAATPVAPPIYLGAALEPNQLDDPAFTGALKKYKFDSLTPENAMKFGPLEPNRGQFNWTGADKIVNYAQANGMRVRGHNLVWYVEVPGWVSGLSNADASAALENHIKTVVGRYKGKIAEWDVVNEALNDDGTLRDSVWKTKLGNDYIAQAFTWAHEADPAAKLYYNEYSAESRDLDGNGTTGRAAKSDAVLAMVKDFKSRGIPIDGVGLQTHSAGLYPGTGTDIKENIQRLAAAGVKSEITELDTINIGDETAKANRYGDIGKGCYDSGACTGVTTWGLYDGHTWLGTAAAPLMLDTNFNAKPSYTALTKAIGR
jgi:endo-1,4-beta-xylanase